VVVATFLPLSSSAHIIEARGARRVEDAVGVQRLHGIDVGGCGHPEGVAADRGRDVDTGVCAPVGMFRTIGAGATVTNMGPTRVTYRLQTGTPSAWRSTGIRERRNCL
jgi:hypothetical protein